MGVDGYRPASREGAAEVIRQLGEDDLLYLNRLIVDRLKLIAQARSTVALAHFGVGDRVTFLSPSGERKVGHIVKLNRKTASIETDDHHRWMVHPGALSHLEAAAGAWPGEFVPPKGR